MQLGPALRLERRKRGLTLAELAQASGLSKGFVSQVENDKTSPSLDTLERLAGALDCACRSVARRGSARPRPCGPAPLSPPARRAPAAGPRRLLDPPAPSNPLSGVREVSPPGASCVASSSTCRPARTWASRAIAMRGRKALAMLAGRGRRAGRRGHRSLSPATRWPGPPGQPHRLLNRRPDPARCWSRWWPRRRWARWRAG